MCGIVVVLGSTEEAEGLRRKIVGLSKLVRHRGPDWSGYAIQKTSDGKTNILAHERLAIVDTSTGEQPLFDESGKIALSVNGEIFNHEYLQTTLKSSHTFATKSDCEIILHLYEEIGEEVVAKLDGMFAFVLSDAKTGRFIAARDHVGIIPLYYGYGRDGSMWFASELKALTTECVHFETFPPGFLFDSSIGELRRWYEPKWSLTGEIPTTELSLSALHDALENSVVKCLMCDVPYGVLLSGGLDSSLVASIASRHAAKRVEDNEKSPAWWPRLHSFSIGLIGSPDLEKAREVAAFLGTVHHEYNFTLQQGLDALSDVIYHIESYDVTTIRASTPMFLLSRRIKATGVKMVLSGEGADEVFGGYLYFHKAPSKEEFHKECCRKVQALHLYDCLRANKSAAAWGIEVRVPLLDKDFLDVALTIDPKEKLIDKAAGRIEKYILRKAFDTPDRPYLPDSVLWRQKEQFSDGVGYGWIDGLKDYAENQIPDALFAAAKHRFPHNTPTTKEAYLYRTLFEKHFPQLPAQATVPGGPSVACSSAIAAEWDKSWKLMDPSGRAVSGVHLAAI